MDKRPALGRTPRLQAAKSAPPTLSLVSSPTISSHALLPGLRLLRYVEGEGAVSGMAAHDGDEDHPSEEKLPSCSVNDAGAVQVA